METIENMYSETSVLKMKEKSGQEAISCFHCSLPMEKKRAYFSEDKSFCCKGCLFVYRAIKSGGFLKFYDYRQSGSFAKNIDSSEFIKTVDFSYLDDKDFLDTYLCRENENEVSLYFYFANIHCSACPWILEKVAKSHSQVKGFHFDPNTSIGKLTLSNEFKLSEIAYHFHSIGYRPEIVKNREEALTKKTQEVKNLGIQLGISIFLSGNIMSLALADYLGANGRILKFLENLQGILFLFILLACTSRFFSSAYKAFRQKTFVIDHSIVFAIMFGSMISYYHLFFGGEIYFDSLAIFLTLVLVSRYLLARSYLSINSSKNIETISLGQKYRKLNPNGSSEVVWGQNIKKKDHAELKLDQLCSFEGVVISSSAYFNESFQTGESVPILKRKGDRVHSGSICLSENCLVECLETTQDSSLSKKLSDLKINWVNSSKFLTKSNKASAYLLSFVFILGFGSFIYLAQDNIELATNRFLAIIIIACPCALALGNPLIYSKALNLLMKKLIFVKSAEVLERLSSCRNIFFDKTGTLTDDQYVLNFSNEFGQSDRNVFYSLEMFSHHPYAKPIRDELGKNKIENVIIKDFTENVGVGVSGEFQENFYEIKKSKTKNKINFLKNGKIVNELTIDERVNPYAKILVKYLKDKGRNIFILSGDKKNKVVKLAEQIEIKKENLIWEQASIDKEREVLKCADSVMVGDGLNDILSFNRAEVGIAFGGGNKFYNLNKADVFIQNDGPLNLLGLFQLLEQLNMSVIANIALSLCFNFVGISLAFFGYIGPIGAAILMPFSSLISLILVHGFHRRIENKFNKIVGEI